MNTALSINANLNESNDNGPSLAKNWERPLISNGRMETNRPRIRLEIGGSASIGHKGRRVNQFLLREEAEEVTETRSTLKARRQEFKALFEAGLN